MSAQRGRRRPLSSFLVRGAALGAGLAAAAVAHRWLDVVEVRGTSMVPTLLPGERLLVERHTFLGRPPLVGEIVLAADPRAPERELIKRVAAVDVQAGTLDLRGDAPEASTDSRAFGSVPIAAVRWRAVARYWPPRRAASLRGPRSTGP